MSDDDILGELRRVVVDDPVRIDRLLGAPDRAIFVARVMDVAGEFGLELSAVAIEEALRAARGRHRKDWV